MWRGRGRRRQRYTSNGKGSHNEEDEWGGRFRKGRTNVGVLSEREVVNREWDRQIV